MHCKSYSHFFSKKFQHICVSLDVNFNESLTNDVVSFKQLGPRIPLLNSLWNFEIWATSSEKKRSRMRKVRRFRSSYACESITKTRLYNFYPLKPHFYIVKLGFTSVCIILLISAQKHRLWVLVRTALTRRFLRVPTIYVLSRNVKNIRVFLSENFQFLEVKFSIYLNRHIFVIVSSGPLLSIHTFFSMQCFCKRTRKAVIRLRGCAGWSGPSLSAYARPRFRMARSISCPFSMLSAQLPCSFSRGRL